MTNITSLIFGYGLAALTITQTGEWAILMIVAAVATALLYIFRDEL